MRRKVVASFMAIVLCALMVLPQMGLTFRDAAAEPGTVIEPSAESSVQQTQEVQESEDQGNSAPLTGGEEGTAADPAEQEASSADTAAPSEGTAESEENGDGTEQTGADAPFSGQEGTSVPADDDQLADASEPEAAQEPVDGTQPAAEDGPAVYTPAEVESIIGDGISLASLQEIMPASVASGRTVSEKYFKFELSGLTGYETKYYCDYSELKKNPDGYEVGPWPDKTSGDVSAVMFPRVGRLTFDALTLNGTVIESIGVVTVTVLGEDGLPEGKDYLVLSDGLGGQRGRDGAPGRGRRHPSVCSALCLRHI